jgi:hypothetical protein
LDIRVSAHELAEDLKKNSVTITQEERYKWATAINNDPDLTDQQLVEIVCWSESGMDEDLTEDQVSPIHGSTFGKRG